MKYIKAFRILEVRSSEKLARETTSAETLMKLSSHTNWKIRKWVAQNPNTPAEALSQLASDEQWLVRHEVAENPNTPEDALSQLANDEADVVRYSVAEHPNTPVEALDRLTNDEDKEVRQEAKANLKPRQEEELKGYGWDDDSIALARKLGL